ncbi:MAG TPA: hypothetical protein VGM03_18865 [Phycisphaerae bacterium]
MNFRKIVALLPAITCLAPSAAQSDGPTCLEGATPTIAFADDFEIDQGWLSTFDGGDMTIGQWVRVDPIGTGAQPEDDHTPGMGVRCYVTGDGEGPPSTFDVDWGPVYLTSPPINLPGDGIISYWRWFHWGGNGTADILTVQISNDDGGTWTTVEVVGGVTGWQQHAFRLSDFLPGSPAVRMRFIASDNPNDSLTEAALDDFLAIRCGVLGDTDGDGDLDLNDFHFYSDCLAGPNSNVAPPCLTVDFDGDLDVDFRDFRALQINFTGPG